MYMDVCQSVAKMRNPVCSTVHFHFCFHRCVHVIITRPSSFLSEQKIGTHTPGTGPWCRCRATWNIQYSSSSTKTNSTDKLEKENVISIGAVLGKTLDPIIWREGDILSCALKERNWCKGIDNVHVWNNTVGLTSLVESVSRRKRVDGGVYNRMVFTSWVSCLTSMSRMWWLHVLKQFMSWGV